MRHVGNIRRCGSRATRSRLWLRLPGSCGLHGRAPDWVLGVERAI